MRDLSLQIWSPLKLVSKTKNGSQSCMVPPDQFWLPYLVPPCIYSPPRPNLAANIGPPRPHLAAKIDPPQTMPLFDSPPLAYSHATLIRPLAIESKEDLMSTS